MADDDDDGSIEDPSEKSAETGRVHRLHDRLGCVYYTLGITLTLGDLASSTWVQEAAERLSLLVNGLL
ncbi:hypothetical protein ABZ864_47805 [Streptomyces sp. NPDC047082]|uniref:hypothetical protein n=1 Tax=Streptomyces sp. NPDC047082 TaxID=3155259 RepID=UPI0034005FC6